MFMCGHRPASWRECVHFFAPVSLHWSLFLSCSILAWFWTISQRDPASLGMIGFHVLAHPFLMHQAHCFNLYIIFLF